MSSVWLIESPVQQIEGETITYSVHFLGGTTLSDADATVYKGGTDYTTTAMPSGVCGISGNVVTLPPLVAGDTDGGTKYVVVIECIVDGNTEKRKLLVEINKDDSEY